MDSTEPRGIYNRKNHCFLNSVLISLAHTFHPMKIQPENIFCKYLVDTLRYLYDTKETANVDLFWCTLSDMKPQLFSKYIDHQDPQDASEALFWIIDSAGLNKLFQLQMTDGSFRQSLMINPSYCTFYQIKGRELVPVEFSLDLKINDALLQHNYSLDEVQVFLCNEEEIQKVYDYSITVAELQNSSQLQQKTVLILDRMEQDKVLLFIKFSFLNSSSLILPLYVPEEKYITQYLQNLGMIGGEILLENISHDIISIKCSFDQGINFNIQSQQQSEIFLGVGESLEEKVKTFISSLKNNKVICFNYQVIQLFKSRGYVQKDKTLIKYPDFLMIEQSLNEEHLIQEKQEEVEIPTFSFELTSVINHCGDEFEGHCTALVKRNERWFCIDDEHVWQIQDHVNSEATILFYRMIV